MREIKFRAWDKRDKVMIDFDSNGIDYFKLIFQDESHYLSFDNHEDDTRYLESDKDYILMQFTGLKDKNGVEIYEGDIVGGQDVRLSLGGSAWYQKISQYDGKVTSRGVVIYKAPVFTIAIENDWNSNLIKKRWKEVDDRVIRGLNFGYTKLEVIGNIHENPDLLKGLEKEENDKS